MTDPSSPSSSAIRSCYRHSGRETRLSCSECGRPICVDCAVDAAVGQKCPECSAPDGRHRVIDRAQIKGQVRGATPFTYALIGINVMVFLAGQSSPDLGRRLILDFAHHPDLVAGGDWYRLVTAMFLHGSVMHLLFNSWALWLFGSSIERRFGSPSFLALYLASGIAGSTAYQLTGSSFAVGASGAIFGLFGALLAATYRQRHTPAGRAAFGQLAMLLAINLALPLLVPGIAWQAHLGGLVAGMVVAAGWARLPLAGGGSGGRRVAVAFAVLVVAAAVALLL